MFKHLSLHCEIEDQMASIKGSFFFISYIIPVFVLLVNRIPTDYRKAEWSRLATSFLCDYLTLHLWFLSCSIINYLPPIVFTVNLIQLHLKIPTDFNVQILL